MSVSKNAVVGKAHRLNLPARPSPIRRDATGASRPAAPRRVTGPTLPPLVAAESVEREAPPVAVQVVQPAPRPVVAAPQRPASVLRAVPVSRGRNPSCCWPIGEPGTKSFRFCDSEATSGKPYCGEHAQLAYVKVRDRREDAVA
jgi:GcrA cell cycle regulator